MPHVVHQPAKKDASRTINKAIVIIDLQARIRGQSSRGRESEQMSIRPNVADTGGGARVLGYILLTSIPKTSRKVVVKGSDYKSIKRLEELRGTVQSTTPHSITQDYSSSLCFTVQYFWSSIRVLDCKTCGHK